jgi:hypothetical protein
VFSRSNKNTWERRLISWQAFLKNYLVSYAFIIVDCQNITSFLQCLFLNSMFSRSNRNTRKPWHVFKDELSLVLGMLSSGTIYSVSYAFKNIKSFLNVYIRNTWLYKSNRNSRKLKTFLGSWHGSHGLVVEKTTRQSSKR